MCFACIGFDGIRYTVGQVKRMEHSKRTRQHKGFCPAFLPRTIISTIIKNMRSITTHANRFGSSISNSSPPYLLPRAEVVRFV